MLKIENVVTPSPEQWGAVVRSMRNAMNSWHLSDSHEAFDCGACGEIEQEGHCNPREHNCEKFKCFSIGPKDEKLMAKLRDAGSDHAKYRRMIPVIFDVIAPLYWWKEFDTYKVGTVANSCSTMHKIQEKEFTLDDFSHEHLMRPCEFEDDIPEHTAYGDFKGCLEGIIAALNDARDLYLQTKDKRYWWQMIQLLPSSYNQRRTVMLNYEVLANIYHARKNHKLDEWRVFCDWIENLPESWIIIGKSEDDRVNKLYSSHAFPTSNEKAEANTENLADDGK